MKEPAAAVHHHLRYRAHIDGLRAVAVLGVVLFHFGANWLPGGFVGVDVFFVISGFLISKSIYADTADGSFSIFSFYERRMRRIVPAFVAVSAVTSAIALFVLLPNQLLSYARSLIWSVLAFGNVYFYRRADYFGSSAEEMPLLHYWSLGVEEQFYFLFPALILVCRRFWPKALPWAVLAILVASLVACEMVRQTNPAAAFYLLPFRAFELLIGAALALPGMRFSGNRHIGGAAILAGAGLILYGMLTITSASPFPGRLALIPCLGAALVLWGGERTESLPARLLGVAPMRFFGAISYSLYLVHWPIVVFARQLWPDMDAHLFLIGGVALSTLLGWLSWRFVEQPVRLNRVAFPRRIVFGATAAGIAVLLGFGTLTTSTRGFPGRMDPEIQRVLAYTNYAFKPVVRDGLCFVRQGQSPADIKPECLPTGSPRIVLWGSSHVAQFSGALLPMAKEHGYALGQITGAACLPLLDFTNPHSPVCDSLNKFAFEWLLTHKPEIVVLGGDAFVSPEHLADLDRAIARLNAAGIKVVVLGPVPKYKRPVPEILALRLHRQNADTGTADDMDEVTYRSDRLLTEHFANNPSVLYVSILQNMCPEMNCQLSIDGEPLEFDATHFTSKGVAYYGTRLGNLIFGSQHATTAAETAAP
ncbi:acyltransferase family protein [Starkeya nomas]|uniref:acyltransferase family protein n=1 Tax=Starkeya nomas TaxID=2666134 RepID=UPI001FCEF4F5|nr:acyltransferase family protein [Starkeya nomas]